MGSSGGAASPLAVCAPNAFKGTLSAAAALWHQADEQVMKDAAFIPFQTQLTPLFRSARVHNAIFIPFSEYYDITQVWLSS